MFDQILCLATAGDQNEILGECGRRLPAMSKPMLRSCSRWAAINPE